MIVDCTLVGGLLPFFEIYYQDRKITGLFDRSAWGDESAILEVAKAMIDARHKVQPFKVATND